MNLLPEHEVAVGGRALEIATLAAFSGSFRYEAFRYEASHRAVPLKFVFDFQALERIVPKGLKMAFRLPAMLLCLLAFSSVASAQNASGPKVGTVIEDFELRDQYGEVQKLSQLLAEGPLALVAIRSAGWCAECKEQLIHLQQELESIRKSGLQVVGLSYDQADVHKDFAQLNGVEFPLLADPRSKVINQLGIVNTSRKKGTLRYGVAHPLTILISRQSEVVGVVRGVATELHGAKQLLDAWGAIKQGLPEEEQAENRISFIKVQGNQFVDRNGTQVLFKGLAIADPHKIANDGYWNRTHFQTIKSWGANLIRIPVHPGNLRKRGAEKYLKLLDEAVEWCAELEMYVIIDWHSIGNLRTKKFESDLYRTSMKETLSFWNVVSKRFADNPTVAFCEVFNEPATSNGDYGDCSWQQWRAMVEQVVDVIYSNDKNVIPLVSGFNWAYDLREVKNNPIQREGVAYVAHPYPGKCDPPREPHWEEHFGFLANRYPVIVTEMGYSLKGKYENLIDDGTYRNAILKYMDKKEISWCAWVFDPHWSPALIKSYNYQPTHPGAFFRRAMLRK